MYPPGADAINDSILVPIDPLFVAWIVTVETVPLTDGTSVIGLKATESPEAAVPGFSVTAPLNPPMLVRVNVRVVLDPFFIVTVDALERIWNPDTTRLTVTALLPAGSVPVTVSG